MDKNEIIEKLGRYYRCDRNEDTGEYDLDDYDWTAGCYANGRWMSLATIVEILSRD